MQEEIERESLQFVIRTAELSGRTLAAGVRLYLNHKSRKHDGFKHGKQSVKQLIRQGQGVTSIPLDDRRIADFGKSARKYGVDYAVVKDKSVNPPKYMVFFRGKDTDALTQILTDYTAKQLNKKPSLIAALQKAKEAVKSIALPAIHRDQERTL